MRIHFSGVGGFGMSALAQIHAMDGQPATGSDRLFDQGGNQALRAKLEALGVKLYPQDAPKTVSNFVYLATGGFYDGLTFHRVESWVVQGGDPTGTGRGGPGYQFEDEKVTRQYTRGIVAMANAGPNTNGSQFFILTQDTPLQPDYTIFGEVTKGMNVVDKIAVGDVMKKVTVEPLK